MYQIIDLQLGGELFSDGERFKNKKEVLERLVSYHDIDFTGSDDKEKELNIKDFFKFWKINTFKEQLNYILEYGSWEIEKIKSN